MNSDNSLQAMFSILAENFTAKTNIFLIKSID